MPEAVRNSVSIFSPITGARAGISFLSSGSVAGRQRVRGAAAIRPGVMHKTSNDEVRIVINVLVRKQDLPFRNITLLDAAGPLSIIDPI